MWLVRASSAAPNFLKQRRKQAAGGVFLFGYFILDKKNKVTRLKAKKNITLDLRCANKHQFAHPTCFGYFLLSKQKQSDSPEGEKKHYAIWFMVY